MNNPFEIGSKNGSGYTGAGFFSDHIKNEIDGMEVGESKSIDRSGANIVSCRSRIQYVSSIMNAKFKTKVLDGVLWVKRIK